MAFQMEDGFLRMDGFFCCTCGLSTSDHNLYAEHVLEKGHLCLEFTFSILLPEKFTDLAAASLNHQEQQVKNRRRAGRSTIRAAGPKRRRTTTSTT